MSSRGLPTGLAGAKTAHQGAKRSLPDRKVEIKDMAAEGDTVAVWLPGHRHQRRRVPAARGAAERPPFAVDAVSSYRLRDGKVVSQSGLNDGLALGMQLGAMQSPVG